MTDMAERTFQPMGFVAIALIGLWLVWRGGRALAAGRGGGDAGGGEVQACCGHAHAPAPAEVAAAAGWRELAALVGAVAVRPCTGALFLLVLTAQMGIFQWGVAGTVAMALGTASVTIAVALGAVGLRRGVLAGLPDGAARMAQVQPALEIAVGLAVAWIAGGLALASV